MNNLLAQLPSLLPLAAAWVESQETLILREGTPLNDQALVDAKAVGVQFPERIRVIYGVSMPVPSNPVLLMAGKASGLISPHTGGMAFRYGIFIRNDCRGDRNMLAHECVHTGQYERMGSIPAFLTSYLTECLTIGYPEAPMEQEAIKRAKALCAV